MKDNRQLRTDDSNALIGYRATYKGKRVLAIMRGTNEKTWRCIGIIDPYQLIKKLDTGPCIDLDNIT